MRARAYEEGEEWIGLTVCAEVTALALAMLTMLSPLVDRAPAGLGRGASELTANYY